MTLIYKYHLHLVILATMLSIQVISFENYRANKEHRHTSGQIPLPWAP